MFNRDIKIVVEKRDYICIIKIIGRVNAKNSSEFNRKIFEVIMSKTKNIILDFADLDYISSAGLRVLLKVASELEGSNVKIIACSLQHHIEEVFEIAGFQSLFPIVSTKEDALRGFQI